MAEAWRAVAPDELRERTVVGGVPARRADDRGERRVDAQPGGAMGVWRGRADACGVRPGDCAEGEGGGGGVVARPGLGACPPGSGGGWKGRAPGRGGGWGGRAAVCCGCASRVCSAASPWVAAVSIAALSSARGVDLRGACASLAVGGGCGCLWRVFVAG